MKALAWLRAYKQAEPISSGDGPCFVECCVSRRQAPAAGGGADVRSPWRRPAVQQGKGSQPCADNGSSSGVVALLDPGNNVSDLEVAMAMTASACQWQSLPAPRRAPAQAPPGGCSATGWDLQQTALLRFKSPTPGFTDAWGVASGRTVPALGAAVPAWRLSAQHQQARRDAVEQPAPLAPLCAPLDHHQPMTISAVTRIAADPLALSHYLSTHLVPVCTDHQRARD